MSQAISRRLQRAALAALIHLVLSLVVTMVAAMLVWWGWYPAPYDQLSGGRGLFLLIVMVDVICGPVLTFAVFDLSKRRAELRRDLFMIGVLQLIALIYGLHTVMESRPIYLVHEVDRFRVITRADYLGVDVSPQIAMLAPDMQAGLFSGPILVGTRAPRDAREKSLILFEAMQGGRDFAQRPDFYLPYDDAYAPVVLSRSKSLVALVEMFPALNLEIEGILKQAGVPMSTAWYVPVVHRQNWVAIVDARAKILGYVRADTFAQP
jgi:hypothetical protein